MSAQALIAYQSDRQKKVLVKKVTNFGSKKPQNSKKSPNKR